LPAPHDNCSGRAQQQKPRENNSEMSHDNSVQVTAVVAKWSVISGSPCFSKESAKSIQRFDKESLVLNKDQLKMVQRIRRSSEDSSKTVSCLNALLSCQKKIDPRLIKDSMKNLRCLTDRRIFNMIEDR